MRGQTQALFAGMQQQEERNGQNMKEESSELTKGKKFHHSDSQVLELAKFPSLEVLDTQLDKALQPGSEFCINYSLSRKRN